jgi:hypothetical protein
MIHLFGVAATPRDLQCANIIAGCSKCNRGVVRACIALHNFLMIKKDRNYAPAEYLDSEDEHGHLVLGAWRTEIDSAAHNLSCHPSNRSSTVQARDIRDDVKENFFEEGAVTFQWKMTE